MAPVTERDAVVRAQVLTQDLENNTIKKRNTLFENAATYISLLAIVLLIVLYAYNTGFLGVYKLPPECMKLDLKSYIPLCIQTIGVALWAIYYISYAKADRALKNNRFSLMRVLFGVYIIESVLSYINIDNVVGELACIGISVIISAAVELVLYNSKKPRKNKIISSEEYQYSIKTFTVDIIFNIYYIKYGIYILIIATTIAPLLGFISAHTRQDYQIVENHGVKYAVIIDYEDRVLAQNVIENQYELIIDTGSYQYFSKENVTFTYKKYDKIVIKKE